MKHSNRNDYSRVSAPDTTEGTKKRRASHTPKSIRAAEKAGDTEGDPNLQDPEVSVNNEEAVDNNVNNGGPRIVINPSTFKNSKDALCVAFNERFRIAMEQYGFEPQSEPTPAQRKFFADTAYADDEVQLRRTILARILTLDTSVKDPTDEQLQESVEFLQAFREREKPTNEWEARALDQIIQLVASARGSREEELVPAAPRPETEATVQAANGAGEAIPFPEAEVKGNDLRQFAQRFEDTVVPRWNEEEGKWYVVPTVGSDGHSVIGGYRADDENGLTMIPDGDVDPRSIEAFLLNARKTDERIGDAVYGAISEDFKLNPRLLNKGVRRALFDMGFVQGTSEEKGLRKLLENERSPNLNATFNRLQDNRGWSPELAFAAALLSEIGSYHHGNKNRVRARAQELLVNNFASSGDPTLAGLAKLYNEARDAKVPSKTLTADDQAFEKHKAGLTAVAEYLKAENDFE